MKNNAPIILIIEDHEEIAELAAYFLRRANYHPVIAADGLEGLQLARMLTPALILCDACLPEMNGLALLATLRVNPITKQIPFVLMSGLQIARSSYPMPDAFLPKPFRMEELLALVQAHLDPPDYLQSARARPESIPLTV